MNPQAEPLRIVVAQRGWVFVGRVSQDGDSVVISDAKCIRRWGTQKGLGQLAANGPQSSTILDETGTVRMHALSIVAQIDCAEEKWNTK